VTAAYGAGEDQNVGGIVLPGHESIIVVVTEPVQLKIVQTDVRVYAQAEQLRVELWEQPKLTKQSLTASNVSSQQGAR